MPARIPEILRQAVVESWLAGDPRRIIAAKHGISEGAVSNIIEEWSRQRGPEQADLSRDLAVALSKTGMSPLQCAQGYRIFTRLKRMGVDEESFESFIDGMNKKYVMAGLDPGILFEHIHELHHFQEINQGEHGPFSIPQILQIIGEKKEEQRLLQEKNAILESQKQILKRDIDELLLQKGDLESELKWDSKLKEKINKNGFQLEDVPKFVRAALIIKGRGYKISDIIEHLSRFEERENACIVIEHRVRNAELRYDELERWNKQLEETIAKNSQRNRELEFLYERGLDLVNSSTFITLSTR